MSERDVRGGLPAKAGTDWVKVGGFGLMGLGALVLLSWILKLVLTPWFFLLAIGGAFGWFWLRKDSRSRSLPPAGAAAGAAASKAAGAATGGSSDATSESLADFDRRLREAERAVESQTRSGRAR